MIVHNLDVESIRLSPAKTQPPLVIDSYRVLPFSISSWVTARRRTEMWQYSRTLEAAPGSISAIRNDVGRLATGINYNSQDYLSLNTHPALREAMLEAVAEFGPHSAGSPMVLGNTRYSNDLEEALGDLVQLEHVTLFPTGWAAGFGSIVGLVRQDDHVVLDRLAHACLQQGARAATRNIVRYEHLSVEAAEEAVREIRKHDSHNGVLVVTDGLFSVDSDWCDLERLQRVCHEYGATLLVDVAHDQHISLENLTMSNARQLLVADE